MLSRGCGRSSARAAWRRIRKTHAGAHALYEESLALFRELGDARYVAFILFFLGGTAMEQGDPERARVLYEESLDMA